MEIIKFDKHIFQTGLVQPPTSCLCMGVSKNNGTPKSSILIRFSIINHPFWGPTPIFGNTRINSFWARFLTINQPLWVIRAKTPPVWKSRFFFQVTLGHPTDGSDWIFGVPKRCKHKTGGGGGGNDRGSFFFTHFRGMKQ